MTCKPTPLSTFTPFTTKVDHYDLPKRFTFPYYYSLHPLAEAAISELQSYLSLQQAWLGALSETGKMFAVLVVKNQQGELGYLASFAGHPSELESQYCANGRFVTATFDPRQHQKPLAPLALELEQAQTQLHDLETDSNLAQIQQEYELKTKQSQREVAQFQLAMAEGKKLRKSKRAQAESELGVSLNQAQLSAVINELGAQSSAEKRQFKTLKQSWQQTLEVLHAKLTCCEEHIAQQQARCKALKQQLEMAERKLCLFLNQAGVTKSLHELFEQPELRSKAPIADSSEENLPKLLNAAFKMSLTPLALGEFWWGASPYDVIRQHKNLYPVCQSKCFEILQHMLEGMALDDSPLEQTPSYGKDLEIVYEDDALVVVNKPAEFLSVSGKYINDSVQARMQARYPNATGPLIVHRLDMSTSGLLVLALTAEANKKVQKQFIERTVEKRYTALLEGALELGSEGKITLPLCGDMQDRPRQKVSHQEGRKAETRYQVLEVKNNQTKVHLYPKTGRTHQLRVHCAHQAGLNTPIKGDDLYGFKADRLCLHAGYLKLRHPVSNEEMEFEVPAEF